MVKYTQSICRQQPTKCLSKFDHFVELPLNGLITRSLNKNIKSICPLTMSSAQFLFRGKSSKNFTKKNNKMIKQMIRVLLQMSWLFTWDYEIQWLRMVKTKVKVIWIYSFMNYDFYHVFSGLDRRRLSYWWRYSFEKSLYGYHLASGSSNMFG